MFAWKGLEEGLLVGEGLIRDISVSGAFILSAAHPPVGTQVQLDLCLDTQPRLYGHRIRILSEATVVRINRSSDCEGFATVTKDFTLHLSADGRNESVVRCGAEERQGKVDETHNEERYNRLLHTIIRGSNSSRSK
jgi:hypothetical protein